MQKEEEYLILTPLFLLNLDQAKLAGWNIFVC